MALITTPKVADLYHQDVAGQKNPHHLRNKKFVHIATSALCVVTGFTLNASTDKWAILYDRFDEEERKVFSFSRDMDEFLDGRFVEVK